MTTSIFLPLAAEYDPDESEYLKSFGVTKSEWAVFLMEVATEVHRGVLSSNVLMQMCQDKLVSGNILLMLAAYGMERQWENYGGHLLLMLEAEDETEKGATHD